MKAYKLLAVVFLMLALASGVYAAVDPNNVQNYFPFDSDANDIVGGVTSTNVGASIDSTSMNGNSYLFGSGDYINMSVPVTEGNTTVSVCAWINGGSYVTPSKGVISLNSNTHAGMWVNNGGNPFFRMYPATTEVSCLSNTSISTGSWYLMCMSWDSGTLNGYINKERVCNITGLNAALSNHDRFGVGTIFGSAGTNFVGNIDEVMVWKNEITLSNVIDLYNEGAGNFYPFALSNNTNGTIFSNPVYERSNQTYKLVVNTTSGGFNANLSVTGQGSNYTHTVLKTTSSTQENFTVYFTIPFVSTNATSIYHNWTYSNSTHTLTVTETEQTVYHSYSLDDNLLSPIVSENSIYNLRFPIFNALSYGSYQFNSYYNNSVVANNQNSSHLNFTVLTPITGQNKNISIQVDMIITSMGEVYNRSFNFSHQINPVGIYQCIGNESTVIVNMSVYDENTQSRLKSNIVGTYRVYNYNPDIYKNFTLSLTNQNNYSICLNSTDVQYLDADLSYNNTGGFTQKWFILNASINKTIPVEMYNFGTTSGISDLRGYLVDTTYTDLPNIITKLLRCYPSQNVCKTVQMDKSDTLGQIHFNIYEETVDYKLVFQNQNRVVKTTDSIKFLCTSGICEITFIMNPDAGASQSQALTYNYTFDNTTKIFTVNFNDVTGITSSGRLLVQKETLDKSVTICDQTITGNSGSISCNVSQYTGSIWARFYSTASPESHVFSDIINIDSLQLSNFLDVKDSSFIVFLLSGSMVVMAIFSPIAAVFMIFVSMIILFYTGITSLISYGFIVLIGIFSILISSLIDRRMVR